jgi:hypothetical protein
MSTDRPSPPTPISAGTAIESALSSFTFELVAVRGSMAPVKGSAMAAATSAPPSTARYSGGKAYTRPLPR